MSGKPLPMVDVVFAGDSEVGRHQRATSTVIVRFSVVPSTAIGEAKVISSFDLADDVKVKSSARVDIAA